MSQQRITLFFPCISRKKTLPGTDTKCYFLTLPTAIRHRIYHEAGLVSNRTIHLNYWRLRKDQDIPYIRNGAREDTLLPALPLGLFAVCRSIYNELRKVLYGENRFRISLKAPHGLRALERMSDATLREIRFLIVRINVSSCEMQCCGVQDNNRCGNSWYKCSGTSSHDTPLSFWKADQLVISQWHRICTKLASSIQPGKLALYVICDCVDQTTAQKITKSLLLLPVLQDCGLRLAIHPDKDIKSMAKDAVMYLTRSPPPPSLPPFRFLDLPKEIQLYILEYASHVPAAEIICTQKQLQYRTSCQTQGAIATDIMDSPLKECFCSAAHSAFNFRCPCPKLASPFDMFLVSREFRDCAMKVFYGKNSFSVVMEGPVSLYQDSTILSSRLNTEWEGSTVRLQSETSFAPGLTRFPHSSISYLASLNLLFECSDITYLQPDQAGWHNWLKTIDILFREADLKALTIQLRMQESFYPDFDSEKPTFDSEYQSLMLQKYENLVRPMRILRGLKNLFVHLNWDTSTGFPDGRQEIEQVLERMVMGQKYDAWKRGKTIRYARSW